MIRTGILTVSDRVSRGEAEDRSGPTLRDGLPSETFHVVTMTVVPDEFATIVNALRPMADECDVVLTTGGTGLSPRDVTPDATLSIIQRLVPGIPEALRADGATKVPTAILSRGIAGTAGKEGRCLVINLPGSPGAVKDALRVLVPILPHAVQTLRGEGPHGGMGGHSRSHKSAAD